MMKLVACTAAMYTRAGLAFDQTMFHPHVSLAYGHFDDSTKSAIEREIGGVGEYTGCTLTASALVVYITAGEPRYVCMHV